MTAFLDTNVLVRHFTGDTAVLAERATGFLAEADELLVPDLIVDVPLSIIRSSTADTSPRKTATRGGPAAGPAVRTDARTSSASG